MNSFYLKAYAALTALAKKFEQSVFYARIKLVLGFLGLVLVYEGFVLAVIGLFNYYPFFNSPAFAQKVSPYTLLLRWDSVHYLSLAAAQYFNSGVFFPFYPFLIRLFGGYSGAGFFVSWLSLALGLLFFYKLMLLKEDKAVAAKALVFLLLAPQAIFFSMIYTESLFLFLSVACWYFLRRRRWLVAGIFGLLAVLTRNVGIFLLPVYLVAYWQANWPIAGPSSGNWIKKVWLVLKNNWRAGLAWSLLIPAGLIGYMVLCYAQSGDALSFVHKQAAWSAYRTFMWPWKFFSEMFYFFSTLKINFFDFFANSADSLNNFVQVFLFSGGAYLATAVAGLYFLAKKYWDYAVYTLLNLLLFSTIFPLYSVERFVIIIFPIYLMLAKISAKRAWLFYTLLLLSALLFIYNIGAITHGAWIG